MKTANPVRLLLVLVLTLLMSCISAFAADDYCYKDSYGRGAGTIPKCSAGLDSDAGLCYKQCPAGYKGVGPVCWQGCPPGYKDTGALCHIDKPLTKEGGWKCKKRDGLGTCWHWVKSCPSGYTNAGLFCALNTPSTPAGYKGTGLDPMKGSQGRGVGTVPTDCGDKQKDAGLCYKHCKDGFKGVGPVCWQGCPTQAKHSGGDLNDNYVNCAAGCATSSKYCASVTSDMVTNTLSAAANITAEIVSLGTSSAVTVSANAAKSAEETSRIAKIVKEAKEAATLLKDSKKFKALKEAASTSKEAAENLVRLEKLANSSSVEESLRIMAGFDPTGIAQVAESFTHRICGKSALGK